MALIWELYRDISAGIVMLVLLWGLYDLWMWYRPVRFKIRYKPRYWWQHSSQPQKRRRT